MMAFRIETRAEPIPGYSLIERIGGGGYGDVWKCEAPGGLYKAIKFVFGNLESTSAVGEDADTGRAEQELKSLERIKRIRHPFILALDRYEIIDGQLMIVTELADCSLHDRVKECQLQGLPGIPQDELMGYMLETAEALDYMTEKHDLLHLDIKPQNLFLLANHIKIGDFGLVKDVEGMLANVTGGFTTLYAAPESFEGYVSRHSDQYSLAIVYQELLTGSRPFTGKNPRQLLLQHVQGTPNLDALPPAERPIVARALSKAPADRWPNCKAFVKALQQIHQSYSQSDQATDTQLEREAQTQPIKTPSPSDGSNLGQLRKVTGDIRQDFKQRSDAKPDTQIAHNSRRMPKLQLPSKEQIVLPEFDPNQGILRPTIVIGLGQFGRATISWIQQELISHYGQDGHPLLHCMSLDTDATAPASHLCTKESTEDLLLMGLNRPSRYLRSRDTLPPVEDWLNTNLLYRMPRTLTTSGIRSLGRLAFIEHYSAFTAKLERDIQELLSPESMQKAVQKSAASIRHSVPRIVIITHLGGGTGSGMFLDCAYVVRDTLRKSGIEKSEILGLLYLPDAVTMQSPDLPEANAVAALHELYHFQQAEVSFHACYLAKSEPLTEDKPPFDQCLLFETRSLPPALQQEGSDTAISVIRQAAECVYRLSLTSLGNLADPVQTSSQRDLYLSCGVQVAASPHLPVMNHAMKVLCNQMIDHWLRPITSQQNEAIQKRIDDFIEIEKYHSEGTFQHLEAGLRDALGKSADESIQELIEPFQLPIKQKLPASQAVQETLQKILDIIGNAKGDDSVSHSVLNPVTAWGHAIKNAGESLTKQAYKKFRHAIFSLMDKPGLRIGAADVAQRYLFRCMDKLMNHHTRQAKKSQEDFALALAYLRDDVMEYDRIRNITKFLWPRMQTPAERLMAVYRARYESFMHERLSMIYEKLKNICVTFTQEIEKCRANLLSLRYSKNSLEADVPKEQSAGSTTSYLMPASMESLTDLAQKYSSSFGAEDLEKIDNLLAHSMSGSCPPLGDVYQMSPEAMLQIRNQILGEIKRFLTKRGVSIDAASLFLERYQSDAEFLNRYLTQAQPHVALTGGHPCHENVVCMVPDSDNSRKLQSLISQSHPEIQLSNQSTPDEVVIYRTLREFQLMELHVLQEAGQQAYQSALQIENFTPHARQDISHWCSPEAELPKTRNL
ncbi:MAG: protein kinase [Planctomycetia bacterium]|nr:protein kinase [Planctomycetia bacterium]